MAIGPRLDLRHSQSLVMTPQLRQAIKLLQFSNLEVAAFIEEELERNPLLERDEGADAPAIEHAALDQTPRTGRAGARLADMARRRRCPKRGPRRWMRRTPSLRPGGPGDGGYRFDGRGGSHDFGSDDRGMEDIAGSPRPLRDHLGEQLRLGFDGPADRLIGAHLIALLCPAGRLTAAPGVSPRPWASRSAVSRRCARA